MYKTSFNCIFEELIKRERFVLIKVLPSLTDKVVKHQINTHKVKASSLPFEPIDPIKYEQVPCKESIEQSNKVKPCVVSLDSKFEATKFTLGYMHGFLKINPKRFCITTVLAIMG